MRSTLVLLQRPGASGLLGAGLVGRIPMGTVGLSLTLLVLEGTGSYASAGAMTAVMTLSAAVGVPVAGRLADRVGQRRFLPVVVALNSAALVVLAVLIARGWPQPWWWAAGVLAGVTLPNLRGITRTRWPAIARGHRERARAAALETVADECAFLLGPLLATAVALRFGPVTALVVAAAAGLAGGLALAAQHRGEPPRPAARTAAPVPGAAAAPAGSGALLAAVLALGAMFGSLHVGAVAFASATAEHLTGVLISALAVGSLAAGLVLSTGVLPSPDRRLRAGTVVLALGLAPLPFVASPTAFAGCAAVAGLGVAAAMTGGYSLVDRLVPRDRITEGMALVTAALSLGSAIGAALAGRLVDVVSLSAGLLLPGAAAAAAAVAAACLRSPAAVHRSPGAAGSRPAVQVRADPR
jgi:MFS family permease